MPASRAPRLRRLAEVLTEQYGLDRHRQGPLEAEYDAATRTWTFVWTDGPTVEQVALASGTSEPEASEGLQYLRKLSETSVALGAVRLAVTATPDNVNRRPGISPGAIEALWQDVPLPVTTTAREDKLVYVVIARIHDDHHRNRAHDYEICALVNRGIAPLAHRIGVELTPIEFLTAHYAPSHAHLAWKFRLVPMTAVELFVAVREDPKASAELIAAALTLLAELPASFGAAAAGLRARVRDTELPR